MKRKSETRGKNGQVSDSRIRGTRYPPERKEKENVEHLILLKSFKEQKKVCIPSKEQKVKLDFHHCYHHHHHTPFICHTCTSWFDLLTCFSRSMVWLCNKCLVCISCLPPMSSRYQSLIRVGSERRQYHYASYHKYYILWEKAYTITALVRTKKYHKRENWESHTRNFWVLFWKSTKTPEL